MMGRGNGWIEALEPRQLLAGTALPANLVLSGTGSLLIDQIRYSKDGSFEIGGFFTGQIDFAPKGGASLTAIGDDGIIARYSARKKLLWTYTLSGAGGQTINDIAIDPRNGDIVYAANITQKTTLRIGSKTKTETPTGLIDMLVGRVSSAGVGLNVGRTGGSDRSSSIVFANSIDVNQTGQPLVAGQFEGGGTFDFDPGSGQTFPPTIAATGAQVQGTTAGKHFNGFINTYHESDPALGFACFWMAGSDDTEVRQGVWNQAGTGFFGVGDFLGKATLIVKNSKMTLDAGAHRSAGVFEIDGTVIDFAKVLSGSDNVTASSVTLTSENSIIVGGDMDKDVDLNPSKGKFIRTVPAGASQAGYFAEYDHVGSFHSGGEVLASSSVHITRVEGLSDDQILVAGEFKGKANLGPDGVGGVTVHSEKHTIEGAGPKYTQDVFVAIYKYDPSHFVAAVVYGTVHQDEPTAAAVSPLDNFVKIAVTPNEPDADIIDAILDELEVPTVI